MLERVGEVFNKEGDPGPSSVLTDLLPTLLRLVPLKVLILKSICDIALVVGIFYTPWAAEGMWRFLEHLQGCFSCTF